MVEQSSGGESQKDTEQQIAPEDESPPSEEQDYQEAARSTAEYADYEKPQKQRNPIWKKLGIIVAVLILVAGLAAGGYFLYKNRKSTDKSAENEQTAQNAAPAAETITTETKHYESVNFKLTFDYPGNWTASEDNPVLIDVLSPGIKLKDVDGKDVTGQIYLRIRSHDKPVLEADATSLRDSEKIAYSTPSQSQRASTYISFLRYSGNTESLNAIYITGDLGYEKDQNIPEVDIQKVDPIISIDFYLCPNSGCEGVSGVYGISEEVWNDEDISVPLTNMLESFVIN